MHSFLQRLNVVFFFYVSVMGVVSGLCALTVFPMWYESPPLDISLKFADGILDDLMVRADKTYPYRHPIEKIRKLKFAIDADLSTEFNWNVKQLFVYVSLYYEVAGVSNRIVVKDWLIEDAADAHLKANAVVPEYAIEDYEKNLKGADVRLELRWDVMPIVGMLKLTPNDERVVVSESLKLPSEISTVFEKPRRTKQQRTAKAKRSS